MYTGIVQGTEQDISVKPGEGFITIDISNKKGFFNDAFVGASVSVDGICLTITKVDAEHHYVSFDVSDLTRTVTTLKFIKEGDWVNIERSAKTGAENG